MLFRVDLYEADGEFIIEAEVPGLGPDDILLDVGSDRVRIRGRKRGSPALAECEGSAIAHRRERAAGRFEREIPLPLPVLRDAAEATLANGLLTIKLVIKKADPPRWRLSVNAPLRAERPVLDCLPGGRDETAFGK